MHSLIKYKLRIILGSGATATRRSTALAAELGANNQLTDDDDDEEDPFSRLAANPLPGISLAPFHCCYFIKFFLEFDRWNNRFR